MGPKYSFLNLNTLQIYKLCVLGATSQSNFLYEEIEQAACDLVGLVQDLIQRGGCGEVV